MFLRKHARAGTHDPLPPARPPLHSGFLLWSAVLCVWWLLCWMFSSRALVSGFFSVSVFCVSAAYLDFRFFALRLVDKGLSGCFDLD